MKRNGSVIEAQSTELVVGDLVNISEGMEIPADGWIIEGNDVKVDESLITGENDTVNKESYEVALKAKDMARGETREDLLAYREIPSPILLSGSKV